MSREVSGVIELLFVFRENTGYFAATLNKNIYLIARFQILVPPVQVNPSKASPPADFQIIITFLKFFLDLIGLRFVFKNKARNCLKFFIVIIQQRHLSFFYLNFLFWREKGLFSIRF